MPLSINTNIASLTAQRAMLNSNSALETSFERLSTGKRINSASDDAAGLAIGKDLESRVSGLNQAIRNVNDGISMVQIAEGALDEVTTILQRMRDLSVQASNGSLSAVEQGYLDTEQSKLAESLGKVIDQSQFNGTDLVSDSAATTVAIQSGSDAGETTNLSFAAMTENLLGVSATAINLAGTTSTAETVSFGSLAGATGAAGVWSEAAFDTQLATGGTGTYSVVIDGTTYETATISPPANVAGVATALNAVDGMSFAGTFEANGSALKFTAAGIGALAAVTIESTGFTNDLSTVTFDTAGTTGADNVTVVKDAFTLTVGSQTFVTAGAAATSDYKTNKQIATALQAKIVEAGVTAFSVGTNDIANGAITLTYAAVGDQSETTYTLAKTFGTVGTDSTGVITEGTSKASDAITAIDAALVTVASERATLGATQAQLESTVRNLANVAENTAAAAGRIMDTDYAAETANLTKAQILQQAATSILAQANAQPQSVLSLLQ